MAFSTKVDGDGGGGSVECVTAEEELTLQDYYLQGLLSQGKRLKIPDNVSLGFEVSGFRFGVEVYGRIDLRRVRTRVALSQSIRYRCFREPALLSAP